MARWVERFNVEGVAGMVDRSSRPRRSPKATGQAMIERIVKLRRQRLTGRHIARQVGVSPATVSRVLQRVKLNHLRDLDPAEPVKRSEYAQPGGLIHIDIKKLGRFERAGHRITGDRTGQSNSRGVGWAFVHVGIDAHSRIAFSQILNDEKKESAIAFLKSAVDFYKNLGIDVERVMTDNGSCYKSKAFAKACKALGLKHIKTRPYTPRTNGKAERFIQTALREWAYANACSTSNQRAQQLPIWIHNYNWHRPHRSLNSAPPVSRLNLDRNNLLRLHR